MRMEDDRAVTGEQSREEGQRVDLHVRTRVLVPATAAQQPRVTTSGHDLGSRHWGTTSGHDIGSRHRVATSGHDTGSRHRVTTPGHDIGSRPRVTTSVHNLGL